MSLKVTVAGASGYAGGEVACLLAAHLEVEATTLTMASSVGRLFGELHPQIGSLAELEIQKTFVETSSGCDLMILAPPHGHSVTLAEEPGANGDGTLALDYAADHRFIKAEDWAKRYGGEFSPIRIYGVPEFIHVRGSLARAQRKFFAATRRVAIPGCDVTTVTLALQPAVHIEFIDVSHIVAVLVVGYSDTGKSMELHLLASQAFGDITPYAVGGAHRHVPEIIQNLILVGGDEESMCLDFTPVLVPTSRGVLATVVAPLAEGMKEESVKGVYTIYEDGVPIIVILNGVWLASGPVTGTDLARVRTVISAKVGMLIAVAAIDNLGKGTAAATAQSASVALGLEEYLGIPTIGVAP